MNVNVIANRNNIVISGTDPTDNDTVQVVIAVQSDGTIVVNEQYSPVPSGQALSRSYPVNPGTYRVSVYWGNGANASIFDDVIVPPGSDAPSKREFGAWNPPPAPPANATRVRFSPPS